MHNRWIEQFFMGEAHLKTNLYVSQSHILNWYKVKVLKRHVQKRLVEFKRALKYTQ